MCIWRRCFHETVFLSKLSTPRLSTPCVKNYSTEGSWIFGISMRLRLSFNLCVHLFVSFWPIPFHEYSKGKQWDLISPRIECKWFMSDKSHLLTNCVKCKVPHPFTPDRFAFHLFIFDKMKDWNEYLCSVEVWSKEQTPSKNINKRRFHQIWTITANANYSNSNCHVDPSCVVSS